MSLFGPPNIEKLKANRDFDGLGKVLLKYHKSSGVRRAAAEAFGELRDARGAGWLFETLKTENDADVRKAVARALGQIGGETAFSPLVDQMASGTAWQAAADALAEIGDPVLSVLIPRLTGVVRDRLGQQRTFEQWKEVQPLLDTWSPPSRAEATRILDGLITRIGQSGALEYLHSLITLHQQALDAEPISVATIDRGLAVLRRIGTLEALRNLVGFLDLKLDNESISSYLSKTALSELDKFAGRWPAPLLVEAMNSSDAGLRRRAVGRLRRTEEPSAKLVLIKALDDVDSEVRLEAVRAVGTWKYTEGFQRLAHMLQNKELKIDVRGAAAEALMKIRMPQAVPLLIDALQSIKDNYKSFDFRKTIIQALGEYGDPRAIRPLRLALANNQDAVVEALGKIKDPQVIEPLVEALLFPSSDIANKALDALKPYGASAIPALLAKLELGRSMIAEALDQAGWTPADDRAGAIFWINRKDWAKCESIGAPAVSPLLDWLSQKSDLQPVMTTLGRLGDVRAIEPLIQMLGHEERRLRQTAAGALVEFYRRNKIDDAQKQLILANRDRMVAKHVDSSGHDDYGGKNYSDCPSDHHVDRKTHEDAGIGTPFDI